MAYMSACLSLSALSHPETTSVVSAHCDFLRPEQEVDRHGLLKGGKYSD